MLRKLLLLPVALMVGHAEGFIRCFSFSTSSNPDVNDGKWYLESRDVGSDGNFATLLNRFMGHEDITGARYKYDPFQLGHWTGGGLNKRVNL